MADESPIDRIVQNFLNRLQDLDLPTSRDMRGFAEELAGIRQSLSALDISTRVATQANTSLAKHYERGSASEAASLVSSQAASGSGFWTPRQSGAGGESVSEAAPISSQESDARRRLAQAGGTGIPQRREGTGGGPSIPEPEEVPEHPRLRMPQIGEFTPQNLLEWASDTAAHEGHITTAKRLDTASKVVAQVALVKQYARHYGYETQASDLAGTGGLQGTGALVGATGGGDVSLGPFGMRIPFLDPQVLKGISEEWQKTKMAFSAGINKTQANTIFDNLYNLGWLGGDRTNQMRSAGAQIMKYNTQLGNDPQVYQAMDKATRMGSQSLKEFVGVIKSMPDAAKAAHVSMQQIVADSTEIGQMYEQQGGTFSAGFQAGPILAQTTGLDSGMFAKGFENPLIQAMAFRNTGLPPFAQGLLNPAQRTQSVFGAINALGSNMSFQGTQGKKDQFGFHQQVSGQDEKAAYLHMLFPEYSPQTLKKMLNPKYQERVASANLFQGDASEWSDTFRRLMNQGHTKEAMATLSTAGGNKGNLGDLLKLMKKGGLHPDVAKIEKLAHDVGHHEEFGDISDHLRAQHPQRMGETEKQYKSRLTSSGLLKGHWTGNTPAQAASAAYKEMMKEYKKANPTPSDPNSKKVIIDLSPAAKKALHIKGGSKDKANAGQAVVNIDFGQGPTQVGTSAPGSDAYSGYGGYGTYGGSP